MPVTFEQAETEYASEIELTERWGQPKLRPHRMQSRLFHHSAQFKWAPAARRSGKSEIAKRSSVIKLVTRTPDNRPRRIIVGAPTYTRVKDIWFDDIKALIPKHWLKSIKESKGDIEFRTHWDSTIRMVGMDNPEIVEGPPWTDGYFDELASYPKGCFDANIQPAFATAGIKAQAWMIGVPDEVGSNQTEYERYYDIGCRYPESPEHCSFWWPATDILPPERIRALAKNMDADTFKQEILGMFIRRGGKAFPRFDSKIHVSERYTEYSSFIPICHSLDFGVRPVCSLIAQHFQNQIWIMDEIVLSDSSTDVAANEFIARCSRRGWTLSQGVEVYGDAAGRTPGSNTGVSDYRILRDIYAPYRYTFRNFIANPDIKDTVNAIRFKLSDYHGQATIFIHPRCERLIRELKEAPWPDKLSTYHCLAALRYLVYRLSDTSQASGVVGFGRADLTENQMIDARYTRNMLD